MSASEDTEAPVTVLLVDDLDENLMALEALLRREGLEILQAPSGREALELLLTHDVALALVDVQMPEMDGFELAELMRGSERTRSVPIIFVTAGSRDLQRIFRGYDAGGVDFLFKPVESRVLRNKVDTFVQLYRQRRLLETKLERERQAQVERQRLVTELQETLRLNEMFMAVLGHDLRNPLSAIVSTSELLLRISAEPPVHKSAERLRSISLRMSRMIKELLDLGRVRLGGGIPIRPAAVDFALLAQRAIEELRLIHPDCVIDLATSGDLHGTWDADRLAQLFSNLASNAVEHGAAGETVRVTLAGDDDDAVVLTVCNAGLVADEIMPHLFDPFRAGIERQQRSDGLGLGLYIVQHIARAHGGTVTVDSAANQTTFTVRLPRVAPAAGSQPAGSQPLGNQLGGMTVSMIDGAPVQG